MVWEKGESGNPAGGNHTKEYFKFRRECQKLAPKAISNLTKYLESANDLHCQWATKLLLEYAYGKPKQQVEFSGELDHKFIVQVPELISNSIEWEKRFQPTALMAQTGEPTEEE